MSEKVVAKNPSAGRKRLVRRVLAADPGLEYMIYIPSSGGEDAPVVVSIHGISRNADEHARLLAAYCEIHGAILVAPLFDKDQYPDYQRLGREGRGKRADLALNLILSEVAATTGARADRINLFGFSGGAQFAHRYAMAHPHRLAHAVLAAAGWYTFPDTTRRFPRGIRPNRHLRGVRFDAEEFLEVPMTVLVGSDDVVQTGLRRGERIDGDQGVSRVERARRFVQAMKDCATVYYVESRCQYEEIEDCDHSFKRSILRSGLGERVFAAFFGEGSANGSFDPE